MRKYLLHQESGFLCDLYFIFYLSFNYQTFLQNNAKYDKVVKSTELYKEIQIRFGDIPQDLYIFFHSLGIYNYTFLERCYLKKYEDNFVEKYNTEYLQQDLCDYDQVVRNMISFYFKELNSCELEECFYSKELLFAHIKESNYSTEEKIKLYEFFANPISYILLFKRTLTEKQFLLYEYYQEHYKNIIDAYDPAILDMLNEKMGSNAENDVQDGCQGYVSYCLVDCFHFDFISNADAYLYVLGQKYEQSFGTPRKNSEFCLENFCRALCDKNRVKIFNLLRERKELTSKDLERFFDFSGSTAYHHISLMSKAGLLKTRNEGKVVFYSVDRDFINEVIDFLRSYN